MASITFVDCNPTGFTAHAADHARSTGRSLIQPIVACTSKDGTVVEGTVVKAVWTKGANFNRKAWFVLQLDNGNTIRIDGTTVKTTLEG